MRAAEISFAMREGMAKPIPSEPWEPETIRLLMPTISPPRLIRGPPLLPGLIAASVWMKSSYPEGPRAPVPVRCFALTMPAVTVQSSPRGESMAITHSPTFSASESPKRAKVEPAEGSALITARSVRTSCPTRTAFRRAPS